MQLGWYVGITAIDVLAPKARYSGAIGIFTPLLRIYLLVAWEVRRRHQQGENENERIRNFTWGGSRPT